MANIALIKKTMRTRNMTPKDMSDKTGLSQGLISRYLHKDRNPKIENIKKIALALGLSTLDLL